MVALHLCVIMKRARHDLATDAVAFMIVIHKSYQK